ncbi:MAG: HAD family hydrolase [Sandaracinus sp.]|nr:HAD family hydrolase [Sandaracinus sp.]
MTLRALLLDAGNTVVYLDHGVIADELGLAAEAVRDAEAPAKRRYEAMLRAGGTHEDGWFRYMREVVVGAGATGDVDAKVRRLREVHDEFNLWRRVPERLPDALAALRAEGWRVGVVSNSEGRLEELFVRIGIDSLFEVVIDSARVGLQKPDPRIFHLATEALDVRPDEAIYAGDIPAVDVDGALGAGLSAVLIDTFGVFPELDRAPRFTETTTMIDALRRGELG